MVEKFQKEIQQLYYQKQYKNIVEIYPPVNYLQPQPQMQLMEYKNNKNMDLELYK